MLGSSLLLLVVVVATAAFGANPREHTQAALWLLGGLMGWLALAAWSARHWRQAAQGLLMWQQGQWLWRAQAQAPGQGADEPLEGVSLAWDGQAVLLLRLKPDAGGPAWLWLERWRDPARWDDLRRAVWAEAAKPV